MKELAFPLAVMLLLVLIEMLVLQRRQNVPWRDVVFNLNSGHVLMWHFRGLEILAFGALLTYFSVGWVGQWPIVYQWVFGFIAWDLCFYWMHRLHHTVPFLWNVHVVHHQGEHFNLSLGIRNSWYSSLSNFPFIAILAVLGLPLEIFVVVSSIHYAIQFYNHNGFVKNSGWLDKFLVTPKHHRVHHGMNKVYRDKNFGGTFLMWDKWFGSFQHELPDTPILYGTHKPAPSNNPFLASNLPFLSYFKLKQPSLKKDHSIVLPDGFVAIAGFTLFALVIYTIYHDASFSNVQRAAFFILIFGGTLAIGSMSDGRRWGLLAWASIAIISAILLLVQMHDALALVMTIILFLLGIDGLRRGIFLTRIHNSP